MSDALLWLRMHILATAISVAGTLAALQLIAPPLIDTFLDFLMVGVVWAVAKLAKGL